MPERVISARWSEGSTCRGWPHAFCASSSFPRTPRAADWPQWRGPNRDGISSETGLLAAWPQGGPRLVWRATGLGEGYASLSVARGRLYTQGQRGSQQLVMAFDVKTGAKIWETATSPKSFRESRGNGPRGTPTVDGDRLYAMAADGTLASLDAATGKMIWSQNVAQKYKRPDD